MNKETMSAVETAKIGSLVEAYREAMGVPGLSLCLIRDGRPVFTGAWGEADIEGKRPMGVDTVFPAGSVSKSFTALLFLLLQERGLLSLDDPVSKYLPLPEPATGEACPTILHLLSHSSGVPELGYGISQLFRICGLSEQGPFAPEAYDAVIQRVMAATARRAAEPGSAFLYSNEMYALLQVIAEAVTKEGFESVMASSILSRLGMTDSCFGTPPSTPGLIRGYYRDVSGLRPIPPRLPRTILGCGGLVTTVRDLGRYLLALLGPGEDEADLIHLRHVRELWRPRIRRFSGSPQSYGLGWFVQEGPFDEALVYHGGDLLFSGSVCALLPRHRAAVAIGQNTAGSESLRNLAEELLALLTEREIPRTGSMDEGASLRRLIGAYSTFDAVYRLEVKPLGETVALFLTLPGQDSPLVVPLVRVEGAELGFRAATARYRASPPVVFTIPPGEGPRLRFGDYLFYKNEGQDPR